MSTVLNYKIPIRIRKRLKDDWNMKLGNKNALKREYSLIYCDNDICYYYCTDDYYVYMNTKTAMKLMDESIEKDVFGGVFIDSYFKSTLISKVNNNVNYEPFHYLDDIYDVEKIKENLSDQELMDIDILLKIFMLILTDMKTKMLFEITLINMMIKESLNGLKV